MSNTKFFNDAIAEAKAIRETALANAKLALEEAFTPQIQSMLEKKLAEEADDLAEEKDLDETKVEETTNVDEAAVEEGKKEDMDEAKKDDMDEAKEVEEAKKDDMDEAKKDMDEAKKDDMDEATEVDEAKADVDEAKVDEKKDMEEAAVEEASDMEEGSIEEIDLDELLAELEAAEEGYGKDKMKDETVEETAPVAETEIEEEAPVVEAEAEDEVGEITVDELKDIIRDVLSDVMGGGMAGEEEDMEVDVDGDGDMDVAIDADGDGDIELDEKKAMEEGIMDKLISAFDKVTGIDKFSACMAEDWASPACKKLKDEISMQASKAVDPIAGPASLAEKNDEDVKEVKAELNEAVNVINTLKSELNEVNLLNAKLLYVNKLFRSKTLTEAQKVKVINAFDRAESVKEVKNIFETIKDAVTTETKKPVNESRSFASKAAGVAPKKPIVESNDFVARMQKLAGII